MRKVIIFSGTTEGRILSKMLAEESIHHIICVATDYGRQLTDASPYAEIRVGRMNVWEMKEFFSAAKMDGGSIVVDATHPYATEVTANIKRAAGELGIPTVRVIRQWKCVESDGIHTYANLAECALAVDQTEGNILLTTGSKELHVYCKSISSKTLARTYVRVLPSAESIGICEEEGVEPGHIIAMQGPFCRELNEAIIKQYHIRHLITKESGKAGGFEEKVDAAARLGVCVHVIARPKEKDGVSIEEAYRIITGKAADNLQISLIGIGMGNPDCLTAAADRALDACDAVFGAKRLLQNIVCPRKYEMYLPSDVIPVLENEKIHRAAIVFSGDTGFYSGAKGMVQALRRWRKDIDIQVIPGISSFVYLASKLGESYDDACLFSIHGSNTDKNLKLLTEKVKYHEKVYVLLSGAKDVSRIAEMLMRSGIQGHLVTGANLSCENETIRDISFEEALAYGDTGIVTALIYNTKPEKRPLINVRRDSEFIRDRIPMTKECIRHESIIRLELKEGDVFYDIGGGTGSVALEAASLHPGLSVVTIERKRDAALLIRENIRKLDLANVTVIEGEAEKALPDMSKPDCVFIGGSGGRLHEIVRILHSKGDGIRVVINAVSLETIAEVRGIVREFEPEDEEAVMISVSDVQRIGSYHLPAAQNPVWIFSFTI